MDSTMMMQDLSQAKIAVIGAGTMGIGIAQLAIVNGHTTYLYDQDSTKMQAMVAGLEKTLNRLVEKQKISDEACRQALGHLHLVQNLTQLADVHLVIEAIIENCEAKQKVFLQLADICNETTIFASNTSSILVTAIASKIPNPSRVVGLHFFNPAPVMKLVEIVQGLQTSLALCQSLHQLMLSWQKVPVLTQSTPGFIVNRIARPFYSEGFRALQEQAVEVAVLDFVIKECGGFAMGPCELTDLIGQDVNFSVTQSVYHAFFGEPRYRPSLVQQALVQAGCLGRKTNQGFYVYDNGQKQHEFILPPSNQSTQKPLINLQLGTNLGALEKLATRLSDKLGVPTKTANDGEIWLDDICLRLSQGESAIISYPTQKTMLLDWHQDWSMAKAIVISVNHLCDEMDKSKVAQVLGYSGLFVIWIKDHPALLTLRTICCLVNEACETHLHGIASLEDIDLAMRYGVNYPNGPFAWLEKLGADYVLMVLNQLYILYGEEKYRPSLYLKQYAAKNHQYQSKMDV